MSTSRLPPVLRDNSELLSAQLGINTQTPHHCPSISDTAFVMEESQKDPHRFWCVTSHPELASTPPSLPPWYSWNLLCTLFFCPSMRVEQREMRDSMPPLVVMRERGNTFSITSIHSSRPSSSSSLFLFLISYVRLSPGEGGEGIRLLRSP